MENLPKQSQSPWRYSGHLFKDPKGHIYMTSERGNFSIGLDSDESIDQKSLNAYGEEIVKCVNACQGIKDPENTLPKMLEILKSLGELLELCGSDTTQGPTQTQKIKDFLGTIHQNKCEEVNKILQKLK